MVDAVGCERGGVLKEPRVNLERLGGGVYRGEIETLVCVDVESAWRRLSRLDELSTLIPFCEHSSAVIKEENVYELAIRVGLPWPFPQVRYVVRSELDEEQRIVSWTRISGNLTRNDGSLQFREVDAESCLARYECTVGVGFTVPRIGERVMEAWILPRVITNMTRRLER